jgi:adenine-specific DNA-methyltransferase
VIKHLGSKRRLVPVLTQIAAASGARTALDLFTGTTRVAQAFKQLGLRVTALDSARYADVFARCYIQADRDAVDPDLLAAELSRLDALPGEPGYVTKTFCEQARFFTPENGARIDAIRDAIAAEHTGSALEPILLTSLIEAADRVDSTTGVQMAYLKKWAPRAHNRMRLHPPVLLPGAGRAVYGDALTLAGSLGSFDLAYLDPPYNQHRYFTNYHVWETLVAWDAPAHYGVACKRVDARDESTRSPFNSRRTMPAALESLIAALDAELVVVSYNDEAWLTAADLIDMCAVGGRHVEVLSFDSRRYVGAQIGIHNPRGERVGTASPVTKKFRFAFGRARHSVRAATGSATCDWRARSDAPYLPVSMLAGVPKHKELFAGRTGPGLGNKNAWHSGGVCWMIRP